MNPVPETETALTVNDAFPVFVRVTFCEEEVLTFTFPKFTDVGDAPNIPCGFELETISTAA
jgi:hypothetical protein